MKLHLLQARLKRFFIIFLSAKWCWKILKKCDIVIYDSENAGLLKTYLSAYHVEILCIRGESIYLYYLLRGMLDWRFWNGSSIQAYADAFIAAASPKIVLTMIDNNPNFYSISGRFPLVKTVFIQNGTRGEVGDIFGKLKLLDCNHYHVDWKLVHNLAVGRQYMKYVSGNTLAIGSLKNNMIPVKMINSPNGILFVSQFEPKPENEDPLWIEPDGTPIYWEQFFYADRKVINFLRKWCEENGKLLRICGRGYEHNCPEQQFFADILHGCKWEYIPRSHGNSAYELIDTVEIVVTIDSTLGYESLGRGKKTAVLSCRILDKHTTSFEFGWPAGLSHNGIFWTGDADEEEFRRVLTYLLEVSDDEWRRVWQMYSNNLMAFDLGNQQLAVLIADILRK